ncbi:hypothetical protein [Aestuariimicrobium ganziense]|nr:hypothetical protein [Aestuariimicrobium ganziense]
MNQEVVLENAGGLVGIGSVWMSSDLVMVTGASRTPSATALWLRST